jgi:hypothetical protein
MVGLTSQVNGILLAVFITVGITLPINRIIASLDAAVEAGRASYIVKPRF